MDDFILQGIKLFPQFTQVPEEQLLKYIQNSEICTFQPDEFIIKPGDEINRMMLVLEGTIKLEIKRGDQFMQMGHLEAGDLTGKLPFSRMQSSAAYATVVEESTVLITGEEKFPELAKHYELIETFVHALSDRVRNFTTQQQQNEKLVALGKLSAGLAHELNNPASAILRSATELKKNMKAQPEKFKSIMNIRLNDEQVDQVTNFIFEKLNAGTVSLSLMEKTSKEDELAEWMEENQVKDAYELSETFSEYSLGLQDLEMVKEQVSEEYLSTVLRWIEDVMVTEKMIGEVEDASRRISDLVSSIKTYSHMDNANEKQTVELHKLLKSTLSILNHKIKEKQVKVSLHIPDELPEFCGFVSELNQVWMNLLDNAIDAVEKKGTIEIEAVAQKDNIILYFRDDGSGIPEDVQSNIFDPFFTTKKVGKGSGLGLDLVHKIIEKHEGTITVHSRPGATEFKLCFPLS